MDSIHCFSKSAEHYTPPEIIKLVLGFWGVEKVDLDPCSNSWENPQFPAREVFTKEDCGLAHRWEANTLFMNPPYGREIGYWSAKLTDEYKLGRVKEAIALVPGRIDTRWFGLFYGYTACFITGRLKFVNNSDPAPFPSVLFYLGEREDAFAEHFSSVGKIWRAY